MIEKIDIKKGRLLGIDWGEKRIGLAISDENQIISSPYSIIEVKSKKETILKLQKIVEELEIISIVIGLPLNLLSEETNSSKNARLFGADLEKNLSLPISYFDERFTSLQAERMLINEANLSREKRKKALDKISASIMLQAFIDAKK